jgi:hypothetical protein
VTLPLRTAARILEALRLRSMSRRRELSRENRGRAFIIVMNDDPSSISVTT